MLSERYVAGMVDSRGSIMIRKPTTGNQSPYLVVNFGWKNKEALLAIQQQFGGYLSTYRVKTGHYHNLWLYGRKAAALLEYARPFVRFRTTQIRLAIEFGRLLNKQGQNTQSDSVRDRKEKLYQESLKHGFKTRRVQQLPT